MRARAGDRRTAGSLRPILPSIPPAKPSRGSLRSAVMTFHSCGPRASRGPAHSEHLERSRQDSPASPQPRAPADSPASRPAQAPPTTSAPRPSGARALSFTPAPFLRPRPPPIHAHPPATPLSERLAGPRSDGAGPGLAAAAEGLAARGAGLEGGPGPVPRAGIFKCPARSRAQEQPARQPARCRGQARIPPAPRARPPPPASCFPPAVGLLPARARLPAANTASGTGCLDSRDSRDSRDFRASRPGRTGPDRARVGVGRDRVARSPVVSAQVAPPGWL